jgi:hypothetical protein
VNRRASRKYRIWNQAWALVAALLPAVECWAADAPEVSASNPGPNYATAAATPDSQRTVDHSSGRVRIPRPRKFRPEELQALKSETRPAPSKIPPPRRFVTTPESSQPAVECAAAEPQPQCTSGFPQGHSDLSLHQQESPKPESNPVSTLAAAATPAAAPALAPTPASTPATTSTSEPAAATSTAEPANTDLARERAAQAPTALDQAQKTQEATPSPGQEPGPRLDQSLSLVVEPVGAEPKPDRVASPPQQAVADAGQPQDAPKPELNPHPVQAATTAPAAAPASTPAPAPTTAPATTSPALETGAATSNPIDKALVVEPQTDHVAPQPPETSNVPALHLDSPKPETKPDPPHGRSATPDPAPTATPAIPATATSAPAMPEAVNQALQTLGTKPDKSPDPGPTTEPKANPSGTAGPAATLEPASSPGTSPAQTAASPPDAKLDTTPAEKRLTDHDQTRTEQTSKLKSEQGTDHELKPAGTDLEDRENASVRGSDDQVKRTACATCGGFHSSLDGGIFHASMGCANGICVPGRPPCFPPCKECNTVIDAFCQNLYQCLCCPDPCYQPTWVPAANASFFADYARPRTVTRLRYDNLEDMTRPDRNQFWINQVKPVPRGRTIVNPFVRIQQLYLYQEAAGERGSFFVEYPYRQINQSYAPTQAGFGDVNFGTKALLFDCEMLQIAFQLRTFMPSGNFKNNLGTGQFALDPSILTSLKLGSTTYFQGQFGNWIPLGGPGVNRQLAGGIFYWFMSLNQVLCCWTPDSPLIATLEMDGWSFEDGGFTRSVTRDAGFHSQPTPHFVADGGGVSYFNIGPGLRQSICNRLDFGGAITWATDSAAHWAQPWFRFEVRFLF